MTNFEKNPNGWIPAELVKARASIDLAIACMTGVEDGKATYRADLDSGSDLGES